MTSRIIEFNIKLCVFGKILEKVATHHLSAAFSRHISPQQHDFFRGHSVGSNLLLYSDPILL